MTTNQAMNNMSTAQENTIQNFMLSGKLVSYHFVDDVIMVYIYDKGFKLVDVKFEGEIVNKRKAVL